jgi:hypothetical protein
MPRKPATVLRPRNYHDLYCADVERFRAWCEARGLNFRRCLRVALRMRMSHRGG